MKQRCHHWIIRDSHVTINQKVNINSWYKGYVCKINDQRSWTSLIFDEWSEEPLTRLWVLVLWRFPKRGRSLHVSQWCLLILDIPMEWAFFMAFDTSFCFRPHNPEKQTRTPWAHLQTSWDPPTQRAAHLWCVGRRFCPCEERRTETAAVRGRGGPVWIDVNASYSYKRNIQTYPSHSFHSVNMKNVCSSPQSFRCVSPECSWSPLWRCRGDNLSGALCTGSPSSIASTWR